MEPESTEVQQDMTQTQKPHKNRKVFVLVGVVLLLLLGGVLLYQTLAPTPGEKPPTTESQVKPPVSTAEVMITSEGFEPATIQVKKGTQVTWKNTDKAFHQVASDPHPTHDSLPGFDSEEPLNVNDSYSYIFEESGTFTYHDHLNPFDFQGTVIVE